MPLVSQQRRSMRADSMPCQRYPNLLCPTAFCATRNTQAAESDSASDITHEMQDSDDSSETGAQRLTHESRLGFKPSFNAVLKKGVLPRFSRKSFAEVVQDNAQVNRSSRIPLGV